MNVRTEKTASAVAVRFLPLAEADAEQIETLRLLRNLPAVREQLFNSHEIGPVEHRRWVETMLANPRARIFLALADDRVAGSAGLTGVDPANGHADWGFYVDPDLQGRGIATAMLSMLANLFFADQAMQKLHAGVLEGNEASLALHRRFGFADEGRRTRYKRDADGHFRDNLLFGLTRERWEQYRAEIAARGEK